MTSHDSETSGAISQVLRLDQPSAGRKWVRFAIGALVVLALLAVIGMYLTSGNGSTVQFETAEVTRGDLTVMVTATGTLQPVNQVDVGTETSGTIETVTVDYNDRVKVGQVLAKLDTDQLAAKVRQSEAALALARARIKETEATVIETRTTLYRLQELANRGMCAQETCDAAEAAYARAEAALAIAKAQVMQAQAQHDADRTALAKAVIRAPIDGMVLKRQIESGQTVTASLQTPVLFVLAESLAQMELHVAVDEADVGQVKEEQQATFTVDAYADQIFPAVITQVRFAPQTVEGVVTYETVLSVDNTNLRLRPGMTATADITVSKLENVLLVPNAALRFTPPVVEEQGAESGGGLLSRLLPRPPAQRSSTERRQNTESSRYQRVWTLRHGTPVDLPVRTLQRRIVGNQDIPLILVSARDATTTDKVKQDITRLLRQRRHIAANEDDDFSVLDTKQIADMLTGTTQVLTALLGAVAAVSLLVGGIGIMNIMLVSVTERTREIGIRLAIGALERDVLLQFLVEAVALSSLGGLFGVTLALIASVWLADLMQVPFVFNPGIIAIAFLFSAAVGVIFGYFPAQRAARLDPIEALRHE